MIVISNHISKNRLRHDGHKKIAAGNRFDIDFAFDDSFVDIVTKMSVKYFTNFHRKESKIPYGFETCKVTSHYKALYYYKQKEYYKTLVLCNSIRNNEMPWCPDMPNFTYKNGVRRFQKFQKVQVSYAFEILFDSDISFLKGLMVLIDRDLFNVERDSLPDEICVRRQDC